MQKKDFLVGLADIGCVVNELHMLMPTCSIFTFTGPLGAGKTTLVQALLKECGVVEPITSPTFTYLNVYNNPCNYIFYHFDLYRLSSCEEFMDAGFDEYLYSEKSWTFIEWPELILPLLQHKVCHVVIDYADDKRKITLKLA